MKQCLTNSIIVCFCADLIMSWISNNPIEFVEIIVTSNFRCRLELLGQKLQMIIKSENSAAQNTGQIKVLIISWY